jgi:hypothetical protein
VVPLDRLAARRDAVVVFSFPCMCHLLVKAFCSTLRCFGFLFLHSWYVPFMRLFLRSWYVPFMRLLVHLHRSAHEVASRHANLWRVFMHVLRNTTCALSGKETTTCASFMRQVLSIKLLTHTPVSCVHACFGKHIVCFVHEASAVQTRTSVVLFPFATCRFMPYPIALRADACSSSKRLKLHPAL